MTGDEFFLEDCKMMYYRVHSGLVPVEDFIAWVREEKAHAYIDGMLRDDSHLHNGDDCD